MTLAIPKRSVEDEHFFLELQKDDILHNNSDKSSVTKNLMQIVINNNSKSIFKGHI
jgi:hypothetical protein